MRPTLLIMWTAFQSFILRHNNDNTIAFVKILFSFSGSLLLSSRRQEKKNIQDDVLNSLGQ